MMLPTTTQMVLSQSNMKHNSASHQRAVKAYLKPKNFNIVQGMAAAEKITLSESINLIVSQFANRLPEDDRMKYLLQNSVPLSTPLDNK